MKIFKPEKSSVIRPALLTDEQRFFGHSQNDAVLEYIKQNKLFNSATNIILSRDKKNHIMVLCEKGDRINHVISSYLLGVDCKTNQLHFHYVGSITYNIGRFYRNYVTNSNMFVTSHFDYGEFSFNGGGETNNQYKDNSLYISYLNVYPEFTRLGIGDVLLQEVENICVKSQLDYLVLVSLMSYTPIDGVSPSPDQKSIMDNLGSKELTRHNKKLLKGSQNRKFIADTYFDKNFFLYSTHGFFPYVMNIVDSISNVGNYLMKTNPIGVDTSLGLTKTSEYCPADFKIRKLSYHEAIKDLPSAAYEKYATSSSYNGVYSVDFSPFEILPNQTDTKFLQSLLQNLKLSQSHATSPTAPAEGPYSKYASSTRFREEIEKI